MAIELVMYGVCNIKVSLIKPCFYDNEVDYTLIQEKTQQNKTKSKKKKTCSERVKFEKKLKRF